MSEKQYNPHIVVVKTTLIQTGAERVAVAQFAYLEDAEEKYREVEALIDRVGGSVTLAKVVRTHGAG